jgi:hypothetical protein
MAGLPTGAVIVMNSGPFCLATNRLLPLRSGAAC